ncbi:MAG: dihydroorotase [Tannerella sp.]|nr:dihydroorotase [Tannerella sp.]
MKILIKNTLIINEGRSFSGAVLIEGNFITGVFEDNSCMDIVDIMDNVYEIDASGKLLLPGVIDDHVHFREPGLTHKGDIRSESHAAVAGGVTTFMDMPNTMPQTVTVEDLDWKFERAAEVSAANYTFFFGGTNENVKLIHLLDKKRIPGIKLFLGASTGNMLVDREDSFKRFFGETDMLIAVHAEKEDIIKKNKAYYISRYGQNLDISFHSKIRSANACYASSSEAVELAKKLGARLHILHLSTSKELELLDRGEIKSRKITGEACIHHLWFCEKDCKRLGNLIKWNPAIKTSYDRESLQKAVKEDIISVVATDHAPHLLSEKEGTCLVAASGGPLVQHSLLIMLELADEGIFTKEKVVEKMCHHPADLYGIDRRGYIKEGYYADIVLIDPKKSYAVTKNNILYKCKWSPFEGYTFKNSVWKTFVNGNIVYQNDAVNEAAKGSEVRFEC